MTTTGRIIITREQDLNSVWAAKLQMWGLPVLELPLLRFTALAPAPEVIAGAFDWILFTSPQGVRAFFDAGLSVGNARLGTLGPGTARTLEEAGHADNLGIRAQDGRELATTFVAMAQEGTRVLLPGPKLRGPEVEEILTAAGYEVTVAPLYETLPVPVEELPEAPFAEGDVIFFCSPSTVRAFCAAWTQRPEAVAIGETTAAVMRQEGFATRVAETPDLEAMIQAAGLDSHATPFTPESES